MQESTEPKNPPESEFYEAAAKIERYEAVLFEVYALLIHAKSTGDVERAYSLIKRTLADTRYAAKMLV